MTDLKKSIEAALVPEKPIILPTIKGILGLKNKDRVNECGRQLLSIDDLPRELALLILGRSSLSAKTRRALVNSMVAWSDPKRTDPKVVMALNNAVFEEVAKMGAEAQA
jgi:hypothetical protein